MYCHRTIVLLYRIIKQLYDLIKSGADAVDFTNEPDGVSRLRNQRRHEENHKEPSVVTDFSDAQQLMFPDNNT
ncbi:MAG: hypothetical protein J07HX5_01809 [halophilic archaeon J07HX5]|nr:MAG: hypothetical protein J07HX5_01809 [halophilic archaeon J07HX5]